MNCPFFFKGWCRKFNGACKDVRNCGFKKGAAITRKSGIKIDIHRSA